MATRNCKALFVHFYVPSHQINAHAFTCCETEKIVNDRPLIRQCDDYRHPSALMPLLLCYRNPCSPAGDLPVVQNPTPSERWKQVQTVANMFWTRWPKKYIPTLQQRQKCLFPKCNLAMGDLVMIVDQRSPRGRWPLGLVKEFFLDAKGNVRQAILCTAGARRFRHHVRELCLLEEDLSYPEPILG